MLTFRSTFRQQITLAVGMLTIVLVVATAIGAARIGRDQARSMVKDEMKELAVNMAGALDRGMFERFREVKNLAALEPMRSEWTLAPGRVRKALEQMQTNLPEYAWIGFVDPAGIVKAATGGMIEGVSVAARPWFKDALLAPSVGDVHEAQLLARLLGPTPSGEPFRFVDAAAPVYDAAGGLIGVLGAHLSWEWASDVRERLLAASNLSSGVDIWILSADGAVILGPSVGFKPFDAQRLDAMRAQRRGAFENGAGDEARLVGFAVAGGYRDYPGLGWTVIAQRSSALAFAQAQDVVMGVAFLGLLLAAAGVLLVWWLAGKLAQPMGELTSLTRQIGRSPDITMLPRLDGTREMVELSAALRGLLRRLGNAEQHAVDVERRSAEETQRFAEEMDALRVAAETDPLTGLFNRRAFLSAASDAMTYYQRYGRNIAVLVVDIDFFKRINDAHGHGVGDLVIRGVGEALTSCVRSTDKVARFGGEEFVVLLREIGDEGVVALAERMRQAVRTSVIIEGDNNICVTVSIGAAIVSKADRDIQDLIERADHALYQAKDSGRNRVILDTSRRDAGVEKKAA